MQTQLYTIIFLFYRKTDIQDCGDALCSGNGLCYEVAGDGVVCSCNIGYSGTVCETDINECESQPCKNTGTCRDGVNEYKCGCSTSFIGSHFEFGELTMSVIPTNTRGTDLFCL